MDKEIFREKSVKRVTSPEELNDYIKVASPSVWLILASVIVLLIGVCVWGIFGKIDTTVPCAVSSKDNVAYLFVTEENYEKYGFVSKVIDVDDVAFCVGATASYEKVDDGFAENYHLDDAVMHRAGFGVGDYVYVVKAKGNLETGVRDVVTERVSPIFFIFN